MTTDVTRNGSQFEITVDGTRAGLAQFVDSGDQRIFFHTEVDDAYEGQGLGGTLVGAALAATRDEGKRIVPVCPFVAKYVKRHEEYADLVDQPTEQTRTIVEQAQRG